VAPDAVAVIWCDARPPSDQLNREMRPVEAVVTYQDSCHLAHGQRVRGAPRKLLAAIPGLEFREMRGADICCGSAGIYNGVRNEMAMQILGSKMKQVNATDAGCGDGEPRVYVAARSGGPHAWERAEGDACGGAAGSGVRGG